MNTKIKRQFELDWNKNMDQAVRWYNPDGMDLKKKLRIKFIETTDGYTRIDFVFCNSYGDGGWIRMEGDAYIQPVGSSVKYRLHKAFGIPIAPNKHFFKRNGDHRVYALIFPPLPTNTKKIDIIEKIAPGNYFNFFNVDFSQWMRIPHPLDIPSYDN